MHKVCLAMNSKIPTIVGILKFMARKYDIACCSEQEENLICCILKFVARKNDIA